MTLRQRSNPALCSLRIERDATIDPSGTYRYWLKRSWDENAGQIAFVMLNPSIADAQRDDPTIRRCIGFARGWGFGSVEVVNLFAFRGTRPLALRRASDPVGPENDRYLLSVCERVSLVVAAWGNHGALLGQASRVTALLQDICVLHALEFTRRGEPRHPLYVSGASLPTAWSN